MARRRSVQDLQEILAQLELEKQKAAEELQRKHRLVMDVRERIAALETVIHMLHETSEVTE